MATPELLQLLDSVLAGEIPEIPVFEQRVSRISAIIRSMDPKEVKAVQSLIQQGTTEGKYDRGNSELVLMYLQSAIRGSSASLRLHTKKARRRREEGETGNAPAQADPNLRLLDTEPDEVLKVPDETKAFLQPFWSGKGPRRSVHHSISPRAKSRDFGALRTLTSELERLRGKAIGWTFRRLLANLWEVRTVETEEMRKRKQRLEACKRLINHLRKALIYPKSEAISLWKIRKEGKSIGKLDQYPLLKRLFTISKTSFYIRKQRFFALWKAKSKPPLQIQSISPVKRATPKSLKRKRATKSSQQTLSVSSAEVKEGSGASAEALELWKRLTMGRWKDTRSPGSALATALLRRADKTLKIALNRVMSANRLSNIQQFGYALARLDYFIAPTDIALKAAFLTWNRSVPRVRKERIRSTLRLALRVYKRLLRLRILTWKAYIKAQAVYQRDLKVFRLIGSLAKVLRNRAQPCLFSPSSGAETDRTHRSGSRLNFGKSEGNKRALRTIIRGFGGGLKEALHLWYIDNVTRRCGKEAGKLAAMVTFIAGRRGDRLGAAFRAISYKADSVSAELQADFIAKVKKPLLATVLKTAKSQLKSTFSDIKAIQQLYSLLKSAIGRTLFRVSELKTLKALRLWQTHCLSHQLHSHVSQTQEELENARKLQKRLLLIWRKQLRTVLSRVIRTDKDRLSLGVKTLAVAMQRRQKGAMEAVHERLIQAKGVDMRFEKMKKVLGRAGLRSIRPAFTHIIRSNASLKLILRSLSKTFGRTVQSALLLWQQSAHQVAAAQTHTALSFQSRLHHIATKTLRKGFTTLQTDTHRVKSALRALYLTIERSQQVAWKQWKMGMVVKAGEGLEQQVKAGKMNKTLERIARKPLRSGLPRAAMPQSKAEVSHKFQSALSRLPLKPMRNAYNRIVTGCELLRKSLQLLFLLFNARPREALGRWKEAFNTKPGKEGISKGQIMSKVLRNSVLMHLRPVYRQLVEKRSLYLAAIRTLMRVAGSKPRGYLRHWRLETGSKSPLSDNTQKLRLARAGELLLILKKRPAAVIRLWQAKTRSLHPANTRKSALRILLKAWGKQLHTLLRTWQSRVDRGNKPSEIVIKGSKLRLLLQNVAIKRTKAGAQRLFFSSEVTNSPILSLISGLSGPLHRVFVSLRRSAISKSKPDKRSIQLALIVLQRNHNSACSLFFSYWKKDQKRLAKRFSQRLSLLTSSRKAITLQAIAALGPLYRYSARIQAAQKLLSLSRRTDIYLLRPPLRLWADIAGKRTKNIRLKGVISFIYNTSISYQSGFWRWGLVREHGEVIFPHQLSFLKNVAKVLHRVQRNRVTTSFTLLSCNRPSSPAPPRSISPFSLHHRSTSDSRRSSTSLNTEEGEYANASTIHTIVNNKLTGQEMMIVRQMGAMETLGLVLRTAFVRNKVAAFVSIRDEAELNEMKECNDLLMGDMANLQEGNKQIMDAFKESTINLEALSRKLDVMRTERVVKVLDKVRMVLPAYEAFLMIKLHAGFPLI